MASLKYFMPNLQLKIITPRKVVLEEEISSITLPTADGEITVLPRHANLFSLLKEGVITIRKNGQEDHFAIGGGFLETDGVEINLLVSRAYGQSEIDEKLTKKALQDAEKLVKEAKSEAQRHAAAALLRRSIVDIKLLRKYKRRPT